MSSRVRLVCMTGLIFSVLAITDVYAVDKEQSASPEKGLSTLLTMLVGTYQNAEQANRDTSYTLTRMQIIRIWPERDDAGWCYVEQGRADAPGEPYRQRIYRLTESSRNLIELQQFLLPNPSSFVGASSPQQFSMLTPNDLTVQNGCGLRIQRTADSVYSGQSTGTSCRNDRRGATYSMYDVTIRPDRIIWWARGFDAGGMLVWGDENGGFEFVRDKR